MTVGVDAVLEEVCDGASYQGTVYDRFLIIRTPTGDTLELFDYCAPLLSEGLELGKQYRFLMTIVLPSDMTVCGTAECCHRSYSCEIANSAWLPPQGEENRHLNSSHAWLLLDWKGGTMLMHPAEVQQEVTSGMVLCWSTARLDLLAVTPLDI